MNEQKFKIYFFPQPWATAKKNDSEDSTAEEEKSPDESAAEASTPDESAAEASTPEDSTAEGSTPADSTPAGSSPAGSSPAGSSPAGSSPAGSSPAGSSPAGSSPAHSTPAGSTPEDPTPADPTPADPAPLQDWQCTRTAAADFCKGLVPNEICSQIILFLTPNDLIALANVNHYFQEMVESALAGYIAKPRKSMEAWYGCDKPINYFDTKTETDSGSGLGSSDLTRLEKAGFLVLCMKLYERREKARAVTLTIPQQLDRSSRWLEGLKLERCAISMDCLTARILELPIDTYCPFDGASDYEARCEYVVTKVSIRECVENDDFFQDYTGVEAEDGLEGLYVSEMDPLDFEEMGQQISHETAVKGLVPLHKKMMIRLEAEQGPSLKLKDRPAELCPLKPEERAELRHSIILHNQQLEERQWKARERWIPTVKAIGARLAQAGLPGTKRRSGRKS